MKKRLNAESVTNELRGGSAFFPNYKKTTPSLENQKTGKQEIHQEQLSTLPLFDVNEEPTRKIPIG